MRGIETDGARIRNLRKARGWTQEELAAAVPCSVRTVRNAERSQRIDLATLSQISSALARTFRRCPLRLTTTICTLLEIEFAI